MKELLYMCECGNRAEVADDQFKHFELVGKFNQNDNEVTCVLCGKRAFVHINVTHMGFIDQIIL